MTDHDEKLDQYIDALNNGRQRDITTDDPELLALFQTADRLTALREPDWPPASFATDMASRLSADLTVPTNGQATIVSDSRGFDEVTANPWTRSETDESPVDLVPPKPSRLRQSIQIAGALAVFAVFAMVLTMVFGEDDASPVAAPLAGEASHQLIFSSGEVDMDLGVMSVPDVTLVNADGTGLTTLARGAHPSWSPDGSRILYTGENGDVGALHTMNADGSGQQRITSSDVNESLASWSPDGEWIAFLRGSPNEGNDSLSLWIMRPDGSDLRMLVDHDQGLLFAISWSPDSSRLAIHRYLDDNTGIIEAVSVPDGAVTTLRETDEGPYTWISWSPYGETIGATLQQRSDLRSRIELINAETGETAVFSQSSDSYAHPAWSPDGMSIAFVGGESQANTLYTFRFAVGDAVPVARYVDETASLAWPSWSPDGREIAFVSMVTDLTEEHGDVPRTSLVVVGADGSNPRVVSGDREVVQFGPAAWRPGEDINEEPPGVDLTPTIVPPESETPTVVESADLFPQPLWASSTTATIQAAFGSFTFIDESSEIVASVTSPFFVLGDEGLPAATASEITISLPVTDETPVEVIARTYTWADNNAVPESPDGTVADTTAFVATTEPEEQVTVDIDNPVLTAPETAGHYVVLIRVRWPDADQLPDPAATPIFAEYAFNLFVTDDDEHSSTSDDAAAIEIVREFLREPDAQLEVFAVDGDRYEILRSVEGTDTPDLFYVDMEHGHVIMASFAGRSTLHLPRDPIDEDMALAISEHHLWMWVPRFEEMSVYDSSSDSFTGNEGRLERIFSVSWAIQDDETGAWIPPRAMFHINMETGKVIFFSQSLESFEHSTVPTITAEQAETIALDHAAETYGHEIPYFVERIDLAGLEDSMPTTSNLVWQVTVAPDPTLIMVDAHTGEVVEFDWSLPEDFNPRGTVGAEPEPDEIISKGEVVDILQAGFDIPDDQLMVMLTETPTGEWIYEAQQTVDGIVDSYIVDASTGLVLNANIVSNHLDTGTGTSLDEESARQVAQDIGGRLAPDFDALEMYGQDIEQSEGGDRLYNVTWMLRDPSSGAWLPTWVSVTMNMDKGSLFTLSQGRRDYHGPTQPEISEAEAINIAREVVDAQFPAGIERDVIMVDLIGVITRAGARSPGNPPEDQHRLAWYVYLEGVAMTPIDAITGEALR